MSQFYALTLAESNSGAPSCDCLAHVYGNAADRADRVRCYPSDMSDAEWLQVRPLLPVPAWLEGRGGQPEGYCHRQMLDAVRYLVDGSIKWRAMPADFLSVTWNHAPQEPPRILRRPHELRRSVGQRGGVRREVAGPGPA